MHVRKQTELTPCKEGPTSVALGLFDGVHLGHQQVLQCALAGRTHGLAPAVFTFEQADGLVVVEVLHEGFAQLAHEN